MSFHRALRAGADGVECDVQKTRDGRFVIIHDPDTLRVGGRNLPLSNSAWRLVRSVRLGRGQRIPELTEFLADWPKTSFLNLELKSETLRPQDINRIGMILDSFRGKENTMISSFRPELLMPLKKKGWILGFLVGKDFFRNDLVGNWKAVNRLKPGFLNLPVQILRPLWGWPGRLMIKLIRKLGFRIALWTVNSRTELNRSRGLAEILITDNPGWLVRERKR